jgi:hypothetical protein
MPKLYYKEVSVGCIIFDTEEELTEAKTSLEIDGTPFQDDEIDGKIVQYDHSLDLSLIRQELS